jgi:hypothetical protein
MAGDPPGTIVVFVALKICSVVTDGTGVAFGTITVIVVFTGVVVGTVSGAGVAFGTITIVVVFTGVVVGDAVIVTLVVTLVVGMVVEFVASWLLAGTGIKNSVMIMRRMSCA